jgi:uncharacterized protein
MAPSGGSADNTIVVTGEGSAVVTPDAAVLQVGLETRADSAGEALSIVGERSAAVLAAARDRGVSDDDLQTRGVSLYPQMDEHGRRVVGYVAAYSLTVRVGGVAAASLVVDAISQAAGDALRLGGFRLSSSAIDTARADAGAQAVDDARRRAQRLAEAAGVRLGRVLSITETGTAVPGPPTVRFAMRAAHVPAPVPLEAGSHELTARVTVTIEIID